MTKGIFILHVMLNWKWMMPLFWRKVHLVCFLQVNFWFL